MNQIFLDAQNTPCIPNKTINLHILKKDIDRRFAKIRTLIGLSQINLNTAIHKELVNTACQTGTKQNESLPQSRRHRRTQSSKQPTNQKQQSKNDNYRSSLACTQNKQRPQVIKGEEVNDSDIRIRVSDYLSSEKKQIYKRNCLKEVEIVANESDDEIEKIHFQNSQDDKIFKSIEFQLHSSFKSTRSFQQGEAPLCPYIISESVSGDPSNSQSESTNSQEQEGRRSFSAINQKQASMKKIRYTDRTALPQSKRIIVSLECVQRMNELIKHQLFTNRKQPSDCKLRSNLIKKVEQKYGEYYGNN